VDVADAKLNGGPHQKGER